MDHTIGKLVVPILTAKSSGRPIARANHIPRTAPTNPSAIDTRQPPREKPVIACPSAPQIPATSNKISKSNNVICLLIHEATQKIKNLALDRDQRGRPVGTRTERPPSCMIVHVDVRYVSTKRSSERRSPSNPIWRVSSRGFFVDLSSGGRVGLSLALFSRRKLSNQHSSDYAGQGSEFARRDLLQVFPAPRRPLQ